MKKENLQEYIIPAALMLVGQIGTSFEFMFLAYTCGFGFGFWLLGRMVVFIKNEFPNL